MEWKVGCGIFLCWPLIEVYSQGGVAMGDRRKTIDDRWKFDSEGVQLNSC